MSSYKVLYPCVVRAADGKSAVDYRRVGEIINVDDKSTADILVASGHLEAVKTAAAVPEKPPVGSSKTS